MLCKIGCIGLFLAVLVMSAFAQDIPEADGFDYPVGGTYQPTDWYNANPFNGVYPAGSGCIHSADDWDFEAGGSAEIGQPVKAIGHGKVVQAKSLFPGDTSLGYGVAVQHHYKGKTYFSTYEHINYTVSIGQIVRRGETVGMIGSFPAVLPHVHVSVREGFLASPWYANDSHTQGCYAGYYKTEAAKSLDGLIDPTKFIDERRVATWHPIGGLVRGSDDYKVYYLEGGKKRWVINDSVFYANGFDWGKVIIVSPQERDCYDIGVAITGAINTQLLPGFPEGTLVRVSGKDPVYVVSEGKFHHVQVTAEEFISVGYSWANVTGVSSIDSSKVGQPIPLAQFKTCANKHPWPHQGQSPRLAVMADRVGLQALPGAVGDTYFSSVPLGVLTAKDGTIYTYTEGGIRAFTPMGALKWGKAGGDAVLDGDTIIAIGCDSGSNIRALLHLDVATGAMKAGPFQLPELGSCSTPRSPYALYQDTLYAVRFDGYKLVAYYKASGSKKWEFPAQELFDADFPPAVSPDGTILVSSRNGRLTALNPDGSVKWLWNPGSQMMHSRPIAGNDGYVYYSLSEPAVVNNSSYILAFYQNGSIKWNIRMEAGIFLKAVGKEGVYLKNREAVIALDPATGNEKWRRSLDTRDWRSLTVGADGTLYIRDYAVVITLSSNGQEKWRMDGYYDPYGTEIAVNYDGSLVFVSGNSSYYLSILRPQ